MKMESIMTSKKKPPQRRRIKLSDGTILEADDNSKKHAKSGKAVYNKEQPDPEETPPDNDGSPYPPPRKNPVFREKWKRYIDNLAQRENFNDGHLDSLEMLCDLYVDYADLSKFIRKNGRSHKVVTVTGESRRLYPEVIQLDKVRSQIQKLLGRLDLFPKKDKSQGKDKRDQEEWS
jgi:phage terminase small subunit